MPFLGIELWGASDLVKYTSRHFTSCFVSVFDLSDILFMFVFLKVESLIVLFCLSTIKNKNDSTMI